MTLVQRGEHRYGDTQADIRTELGDYALMNDCPIERFADVCRCGGRAFRLKVDDTEGVAVRSCGSCGNDHPIGDSADYVEEASLESCECPCGLDLFEVTAGVSLFEGTDDVRWIYLGCRCTGCGLAACYADWKCESGDYRGLLGNV